MNSIRPIDLAIEFVERLNRRDFDGLTRIMAPNFRLGPGGDEIIDGPDESREALVGYTSAWPDFQIHISDVHVTGDTVVMVGRSTGSCENVPRGGFARDGSMWRRWRVLSYRSSGTSLRTLRRQGKSWAWGRIRGSHNKAL